MDLIYANENKEDIGVLQFYDLDMAYGTDENNFVLEINLDDHCMNYGYFIYAENTEYGGIVDTIEVDNASKRVRYLGRTWHGILANSVICPDGDYYRVNGEANEVIAEIIERQGLTDIFEAESEESGIDIADYEFRYQDAYSGIIDMLRAYQGKVIFAWIDGKIRLSAHLAIDFTNDDEWDSSQLEFQISQNNRPVNHLICLGQGNLEDRAVIHLFTDEDGNIQEYASENPMEDADYILTTENQVLFGVDEICESYDYSSAEILINYIPLSEEPSDWISNHTSYFKSNEDGGYDALEVIQQDKYTSMSNQPSDWASNFGRYYVLDGGDYKTVTSITADNYERLFERPSDWQTNYANYYKTKDGAYVAVESVTDYTYKKLTKIPTNWKNEYQKYYTFDGRKYNSASGDSKTVYYVHLGKPSDWDDNYGANYWKAPRYAIKASNNKNGYEIYIDGSAWQKADKIYVVDKAKVKEWKKATKAQRKKIDINKLVDYYEEFKKIPKWRKDTYYNQGSITVPPKFKSNYYYSQTSKQIAPTYTPATYYRKTTSTTAPTFVSNTYYFKETVDVYNTFIANKYFRQSEDRYFTLVEGGIARLQESYATKDSVSVDLEESQVYDISDIVGAMENITGISVKQYINKKIIKIENGIVTISYTIGKE